MMTHHDATIRVRYAETDQMGVVYYANYLIWFEVGRVELMRPRLRLQAHGNRDDTFIVVADVHCRHHPARYDELLIVRTSILEAKPHPEIRLRTLPPERQQTSATGHTIHVACNRAGHVKHFQPSTNRPSAPSLNTPTDPRPRQAALRRLLFFNSLLCALCASSLPPLR
jgi:acyl-CoA thioester hydrolase